MEKIQTLWRELYKNSEEQVLDELQSYLRDQKKSNFAKYDDEQWYQKAVVYSLYVQFFDRTIEGLKKRLPYLQDLGVNCLWLLPVLESPMCDAGYDVSDYMSIRSDLVENKTQSKQERLDVFRDFITAAHEHGIRIVIDVVLNHSSSEHRFFQQAIQDRNSEYHDYYVWSDTGKEYPQTRIIFEGLCTSNWEYSSNVNRYYLHRFYPQQPDWNYRNPKVLLHILRIFVFWKQFGIDGFRLDATPFLWKEEGTNCESLPQCHTILKIIRAVLDYLEPGTLLLAEACQPTSQTVAYFAEGDECHAAYHFPLMPKIFLSLAKQNPRYISDIWQQTQQIPSACQWFVFLRCHDELTLEMSSSQERSLLYEHYCKNPQWNFRNKNGISARLSDLLDKDPRQIKLAFTILATLPGTPVIYYGDEIAMQNDNVFYEEMIEHTGYADTRNLCRNRMDWQQAQNALENAQTLEHQVHTYLRNLLQIRQQCDCFFQHNVQFVDLSDASEKLLVYDRAGTKSCRVVHNLGEEPVAFCCDDMITGSKIEVLQAYQSVIVEL
ncbi:alpha-amylase family glycosyl hydrolase [Candidatus Uabimicrobium amorphum]|uniref:Trehalose synthase n=1 Tax=Uabimicrobium amorphum TaxID=2596890 RepID=A0A5S9F7E9_UABAM|nr:alpha-amylase family glycosyl hydrolase [Candidatus Uabimicrobium amorphum]BBM87192.1 trehalose synthase [Candidatus Uabimicrobium amorphum]